MTEAPTPEPIPEPTGAVPGLDAASRREALERVIQQHGLGAYLLSWVILLVWACLVVLTSPARGLRWLLGRSRQRGAVRTEAAGELRADDGVPSLESEPALGADLVPPPAEVIEAVAPPPLTALDAAPEEALREPDADTDENTAPLLPTPSWYRHPEFLIAVVYLQLIVVAELVAIGASAYGPVAHVVLIAVLLLHRSRTVGRERSGLLLALTLPSVMRIASLVAPQAELDPIWSPVLVAIPVLAAAYLVYRRSGLTGAEIGYAQWAGRGLLWQLPIALLGLPLGLIEFAIRHPAPLVPDRGLEGVVIASLVLLGGVGFVQELMLRGLMQSAASRAFGRWLGIVWVAAAAAALRLSTLSAPELLLVFGVGLVFGALVSRTRSLLGVGLAQGLSAIVLLVLAPLGMLPLPSAFPAFPTFAAARPPAPIVRTEVPTTLPIPVAPVADASADSRR